MSLSCFRTLADDFCPCMQLANSVHVCIISMVISQCDRDLLSLAFLIRGNSKAYYVGEMSKNVIFRGWHISSRQLISNLASIHRDPVCELFSNFSYGSDLVPRYAPYIVFLSPVIVSCNCIPQLSRGYFCDIQVRRSTNWSRGPARYQGPIKHLARSNSVIPIWISMVRRRSMRSTQLRAWRNQTSYVLIASKPETQSRFCLLSLALDLHHCGPWCCPNFLIDTRLCECYLMMLNEVCRLVCLACLIFVASLKQTNLVLSTGLLTLKRHVTRSKWRFINWPT